MRTHLHRAVFLLQVLSPYWLMPVLQAGRFHLAKSTHHEAPRCAVFSTFLGPNSLLSTLSSNTLSTRVVYSNFYISLTADEKTEASGLVGG
jgi:hypothetical protein